MTPKQASCLPKVKNEGIENNTLYLSNMSFYPKSQGVPIKIFKTAENYRLKSHTLGSTHAQKQQRRTNIHICNLCVDDMQRTSDIVRENVPYIHLDFGAI